MAPLKNGRSLRENTIYIRILILGTANSSIPEKWEFNIKKTMKLQLILSLMIII